MGIPTERFLRPLRAAKGGDSSAGSGSESPDSLHSTATAKVLDLVSEGPIVGLVSGLQSVFYNGTPVQNADGSQNFTGVTIDYRWGTQDQTYLSGFPSVENEHAVGIELRDTQPWTQAIEDLTLSAVRITMSVPQLQQENATSGDITGYRVEYAIDLATDSANFQQVLTGAFDGKTTSEYERSIRIELPTAASGWTVRVRRTTPNANSTLIADTTTIESYTEIVDAKLRYPMSAVIGQQFDAQQFQSVPTRSFLLQGRIIQVPSNYDPVGRTYSGVWDGTFKLAYSNNPAWVFYDLVLNDRYGLGRRVNASQVDKWSLYQIAQYCDVMVSDGKGGEEPRFTCNVYIQAASAAYKVLQDIASIFRGMAYWGAGNVVAVADMPSDPVYVYTAANVIDGQFKYVGSTRSTRYTVALVSWNDPSDHYKQKVEYVSDDDGIARYGIVETQISAFGCASQGQAQRAGKWTLLTSRLETETLTFQVGLDSILVGPGQIIGIADPNRAGRRAGGRVKAVNGRAVTLDKAPAVAAGDTLTIILPSGTAERHQVQSVDGDEVTIADDFSSVPVPQSIWMVESTDLVAQLFRVLYVKDLTDNQGNLLFEISATQHEPGKFDAIDNGTRIDPRPVTIIPPSVQPPPTNVRLSTYNIIDQGIARTMMTIAWDSADKAVSYTVQWRKDNGEWVNVPPTGSLSIDVTGIYEGSYVAGVRATNAMGVTSIPAYSTATQLQGKTSPPPSVTSLTAASEVFAIGLAWGFPDGADDTQRTEIWYAAVDDRSQAGKLSDYAYPQSKTDYQGLAAGQQFFFWARLVDRSGNIGPWYPVDEKNGVVGASSSDATPILSYLTGEITKTQLGQDVLGPVNAIGGIQQDINDNATAIAKETSDRTTAISAEADARTSAIAAEAQARGTAITSEQEARQDADEALSTRIDTISAAVGENASAIQSEETARADADSALGERIDSVVATASGNSSAISEESTARVDGDTANAQAITALSSKVDQNAADITSESTTRADADSALSERIDSVSAEIVIPPMAGSTNDYAGATTGYAGVWSEQSARAEADLALAQKTEAVTAQMTSSAETLAASIQEEATARADADSAQAEQIVTVQAQANESAAAVQTVAQSYADLNGRVSASYTIKTQVTSAGRTYIASIGVGVDNNSGVIESEVLVAAQRFAVLDNTGATVSSPFVIQGGQVFLSQAFIGTGWIQNANIGDVIQSTAVGANGQPRWKLDKNGTLTMNGANGGGGYLTLSDSTLLVYDNNGTLRVRLGLW